jgi:hypothetical protein
VEPFNDTKEIESEARRVREDWQRLRQSIDSLLKGEIIAAKRSPIVSGNPSTFESGLSHP